MTKQNNDLPASSIDSVLAAIVKRMTEIGFSKWALAEFAGLHKNTLQGIGTDKWTPSVSTIRRLQVALRPPIKAIREDAKARNILFKPPAPKRRRRNGPRAKRVKQGAAPEMAAAAD